MQMFNISCCVPKEGIYILQRAQGRILGHTYILHCFPHFILPCTGKTRPVSKKPMPSLTLMAYLGCYNAHLLHRAFYIFFYYDILNYLSNRHTFVTLQK